MKNALINSISGLVIVTLLMFTPVQSAHAGWQDNFMGLFSSLIQQIVDIGESLFGSRDSAVEHVEQKQEDGFVKPTVLTEINCDKIPSNTGPESLRWHEKCDSKKLTPTSDLAPKIINFAINGLEVELTIKATRKEEFPVCGPMFYAQIHWGSESSEDVNGLGCSSERQTLKAKHTFKAPGIYTIYVTDKAGLDAKETITVGGNIGYTISDVLRVEKELVNSNKMDLDGGYTLYRIYLKDSTTREVSVSGMYIQQMVEKSFADTGFSGDFNQLIELAI